MRKAYKYRLYPTCKQTEQLQWTLDRCRELYNAALSERKDAYKKHQRTTVYQNEQGQVIIAQMEATIKVREVTYLQQKRDIVEIKELRPEYKAIHSQVLQDVIGRVDKTYKDMFGRLARGEKAGFPRFKGGNRYDSFTYPQTGGFSLTHDHRVCLSKIGSIKVKMHRPIQGTIKTLTIKREGDQWYAVFSCDVPTPEPLPVVESEIGIDLGVTHFAALSDETFIESPRLYRKAQTVLKVAQQGVSRKKRGSHRRKKMVKRVAKLYRKVKNQRADFQHKAARQLVNEHQIIVFEDLQLTNLVKHAKPKQDEQGNYLPNGAAAKSGLTKSILDNGLGQFVSTVTYKAAEAGRQVYTIDPRYTSQVCSGCGTKGAKKDLSERVHTCTHCGLVLDRDTNAAKNILMAWKMPTVWERVRSTRAVEAPAF
jgi:putative transposase